MKKLLVNEIVEGDNISHGYAAYEETLVENLRTVFSQQELLHFLQCVDNSAENFGNIFTKFCQFIVYISFHKLPKLSFGMVVIDCYSNTDAALDEYLMLNQYNWAQWEKDKFMLLFQEIQNDPETELAEMTLQVD